MVRTFFALGCLMLCLGLFSCYDENGTYGSDLVDSAFRNVRIDTSTVVVTSVLIDSLETSGKNVALVGRYKHYGESSRRIALSLMRDRAMGLIRTRQSYWTR